MVLRRITTGTIAATAATWTGKLSDQQGAANEGPFIGKVEKIAIVVSASSGFKLYTLQSDGSTAEEYIFGSSGTAVTVAADKAYYPRRLLDKIDGTATTTREAPIVYGDIYIDVSSLTAADTFEIIFFISDR